MSDYSAGFSRQAIILLLLFSCIAIGFKTWLVGFLPSQPVPQAWDLSMAGALALTLAGLALCSVILNLRFSWRLGLSVVLVMYGVASLFLQDWNAAPRFETTTERYWLAPLPAGLVTLMGLCCGLGLRPRARLLWRISGALSVVFGTLVIIGDLNGMTGFDFARWPASQASFVGAFFAIVLGLIFWLLPAQWQSTLVSVPRSALWIGCVGVCATLVLMYMATLAGYEERQQAARDLLLNFGLSIEQAAENRVDMLQQMVEVWSVLPREYGPELYLREARSLAANKPSFLGFIMVGPRNTSNWRYAPVPAELLWFDDQLLKPATLAWLREFRDSTAISSWYFPDPDRPSRAMIVVRPSDSRAVTLISALDLNVFIQREIRKDPGEFIITIARDGTAIKPLEGTDSSTFTKLEVYAEHKAQLPSSHFSLALTAQSGLRIAGDQIYQYLPLGILIFGLILTHQLMLSRSLGYLRDQQGRSLAFSQQRFRSLYDHNPDAVFSIDSEGRYQSINPVAESNLGVRASELVGTYFKDWVNERNVPGHDLAQLYRAYDDARRGYPRSDFSMAFTVAGGTLQYFDVTFLPIVVDGRVDGVFGIAKNISSRVEIRKQQRIMQRSLEASSNAVVIIDVRKSGCPIDYVNPAFTQITGYSAAEVRARSLEFLIGENTEKVDVDFIRAAVDEQRPASITIRSYRKNGTPFWNQLFLSPVSDDGEVTHFIAVMNDISEKKEQDQELAYQATHDVLTGLANRSLFDDRLHHDFQLARRNNKLMAVLFIDLDEFKPINDTLGHKVGDKLLISVTERLSASIRPTDTLARFGGDEFVLLLPDLAGVAEAEDIAERILEELARPHQIDQNELHISASIGIAMNSEALPNPEKLLQQADMAMYKAKQRGRDTFEIFSSDLDEKLSKRVTLRNDLQEAIKREQLYLHYQPLVGKAGEFVGVEALVRWRHPLKGNISPADFIPIAEETGQITPLGKWVTRRACADALTLVNLGLLKGCMAVNLSPMQFHRPNFLTSLRKILDETGLPPQHLELELTEGILMKDTDGAIDILNALAGLGVKTAIDDFGTGFSSFGYLRELPVDKIKIDRSFVKDVTTSEKDAAVCKGVITLARELDMMVVAEGVETEEQYRYLARNGCSSFQGYFFARPMPFDELVTWIDQRVKGA